MNSTLIISDIFEQKYKEHNRFIDISTDIDLNISVEDIRKTIESSGLFYKLSNKRYIKIEWVTNRMHEYFLNEGKYITKTIAEEIIRNVSAVKSVNRKSLNSVFFSRKDIIVKEDLELIEEKLIKHYLEWGNDNFSKVIHEINESNDTFTYLEDEIDKLYTSDLEVNLAMSYNCIKLMNEKNIKTNLDDYIKKNNISFFVDLCQRIKNTGVQINISEVLRNSKYTRTSICRISSRVGKDFFDFTDFSELNKKILSKVPNRDWECYTSYIIEKNCTLEKLGVKFNISRERVRQIIKKVDRVILSFFPASNPHIDYLNILFEHLDIISMEHLLNSELIKFGSSRSEVISNIMILNHLYKTEYQVNEVEDIVTVGNKLGISRSLTEELFNNTKENTILITRDEYLKSIANLNMDAPGTTALELLTSIENLLIDDNFKYILIKKTRITNVDVCKWILYNLREPVHYSVVHKKYCEYVKDYKISPRLILATLDRSKNVGIIRTSVGTYGLTELGAKGHKTAVEMAVNVLKKYDRPMHYNEIIKEIQVISELKPKSIYAFLTNSNKFMSNGDGVYALKSWRSKLDENFKEKQSVERSIQNHSYNKYSNYTIKYLIKEKVFDNSMLRLPSNIPVKISQNITIVTIHKTEFILKYYPSLSSLYKFDRVLHLSNISPGDIIYLEVINSNFIRLYTEEQYSRYIEGDPVSHDDKRTSPNQNNNIDEVLNIFFKEV